MKKTTLIAACLLLSAQVSLAEPSSKTYNDDDFEDYGPAIKDPLEKLNRKIFTFNNGMDVMVFRPIDKIYRATTPSFFRTMVHNALRNLREPVNFINAVLQLNPKKASNALGRFIVNSTWGIAGISDVAGYAGMRYDDISFGKSTLSKYGVKPGPYLVLPIIGPSSMRDSIGLGGDILMDPFTYTLDRDAIKVRLGAEILDGKDQFLDTMERIEKISLDEYATIRSLYTQKYR